jgi:high-affinity nickel-transport protein
MSPIALLRTEPPAMDPTRRRALWCFRHRGHLTLFGRSVALVGCELLANATCWVIAGVLFAGHEDSQPILSLALLAWVCNIPPCIGKRMQ